MPNLENYLYNQGSCFVGSVSISRVIQLRTHDEKLVLGPGAASAGGGERIKVRRYRRWSINKLLEMFDRGEESSRSIECHSYTN